MPSEPIIAPPPATVTPDLASPSPFNRTALAKELTGLFGGTAKVVDKPTAVDPHDATPDETLPNERELTVSDDDDAPPAAPPAKPTPAAAKPQPPAKLKLSDKPVVATPTTPSATKPGGEQATKTGDTPTPPTAKTTTKAQSWKELNAERYRLRDENATLNTKLKEYEERLATFNQVSQEREQLSKVLQEVAIDRDPRVVGPLVERANNAVELAKTAVSSDQADRVVSLLQQPDSDWRTQQLEEIADSLSTLRRGKFLDAINEVDKVDRERRALSSRGEQLLQQRRQEQEQQRSTYLKTFDKVLDTWNDVPLFTTKEGDDAHNTEVQERVEVARNIFSGKLRNVEELAQVALWAASGPALVQTQRALVEENTRLREELASLRGAEPGLGESGDTAGAVAAEAEAMAEKPKDMPYTEFVARKLVQEGAFAGR